MQWPGKVLEVRLQFSEPILNTFGTVYRCIIVHEVYGTIRVKMQHIFQDVLDLPAYLDISWLFAYTRGTPGHHFHASRTMPNIMIVEAQ
ncbi:hypothetical protein TNCV_2002131 [Trichonephila clavipes]|nr:hypothetical protein TNCV_2002131 [Trichonephila clavipes]